MYISCMHKQSCVAPLLDMMHSAIFMHVCEVSEACVKYGDLFFLLWYLFLDAALLKTWGG
jgi:hypothetical protein